MNLPAPPRGAGAAVGLVAGTLAIWLVFSWPLPRYVTTGIPSSSQNIEAGAERRMMPGDHLQLLYHYWLASDMLAGRTPWFHNVYEFNTGDDAERYRLHPHYAPMSWVYGLFATVLSRAAAYNLTGLVSLGLTVALTWWLARRYTSEPAWAVAAALLAILIPYRWAQLLGGSPAGHAMAWVPLICLGMDIAVRDLRFHGAALAGMGLLFAAWGDSHVFFFGALVLAGWTLVALLADGPERWRESSAVRRLVRLALAAVIFVVPAILMLWLKTRHLAETTAAAERALAEVRIFSPSPRDFFRRGAGGLPGHVYIGFVLPALTAALGLAGLWRRCPPLERSRRQALWLLIALLGLIGLLAMGPHGPARGLAWRAATRALPPYRWVRQPAKIMCLLPTLWPMALVIAASATLRFRRRSVPRAAAVGVVALAAADFCGRVRATICTLDEDNAAYRAIAETAAREGRPARALALPLWPGDAAESSVYSYFASLHHIRLANGYSPAIRHRYLETFYRRFRDLNHGDFDPERLDDLWHRGIRAILIHEDSSEKVSPFPAGFLCAMAATHPRLELLARDGRVWAYAIRPPSSAANIALAFPPIGDALWAPARRLEIERGRPRSWELPDPDCSSGARGALSHPSDLIELPRVPLRFPPDVAWRLRVRGEATLSAQWTGETATSLDTITIASPEAWSWVTVPRPELHDSRAVLRLSRLDGRAEIDVALFINDRPIAPLPDHPVRLPAHWFFRAGCLAESPEGHMSSVRLERDRDPSDRVFYGPWRPLAPGRYRARLRVRLPEPVSANVRLGEFRVEQPPSGAAPLVSGGGMAIEPPVISLHQTKDIPLVVSLRFTRAADLIIDGLELESLP